MTVSAVIFDLGGGVLGSPLLAFRDYEVRLGLAPGARGMVVVRAGSDGAWARLERGEHDMATFVSAFDEELRVAGVGGSAAVLMGLIAEYSPLRPAMVAAVRRLRERGLRTAALTNNWVSVDQTEKMDLLRREFDVFIESARVGMRKPDPRIYQLACEKLAIEPAQAVFLDDLGENLKAARALGMITIKVVDPGEALAELEKVLGFALSE
jgi:putative hydrolase of the HAD superfamily